MGIKSHALLNFPCSVKRWLIHKKERKFDNLNEDEDPESERKTKLTVFESLVLVLPSKLSHLHSGIKTKWDRHKQRNFHYKYQNYSLNSHRIANYTAPSIDHCSKNIKLETNLVLQLAYKVILDFGETMVQIHHQGSSTSTGNLGEQLARNSCPETNTQSEERRNLRQYMNYPFFFNTTWLKKQY